MDLTAAGPSKPEAAVRAAYDALRRHDLISFTAQLDDQIEWHHPRGFGVPFGGPYRGPVAVLQNVVHGTTQAWAQVDYLPAFGHVWLLRGGRAGEVHIFEDTAIALRHGRIPEVSG